MFDATESGFYIRATLLVQGDTLFGEQVFFGLLAIFSQFDTDLDTPVYHDFSALGLEQTDGTLRTFIETSFGQVAVFGSLETGFAIGQGMVGRVGEFIFICIIRQVFNVESSFLDQLGFRGVWVSR